jgi:cation transport ATPase
MGFPIQEVASATGLQLYADKGPFVSKDGTMLGFKRGFLFAIGVRAQDSRVGVMVRFKSLGDKEALVNSLKADAAMKQMYTLADIKVTSPQTVVWTFNKPMRFKTDEFAAALESMAAVTARFAQALEPGKCESCSASISLLTLANGIPTLICEACKGNITAQQERAREEYERRQPNPAKAVLFGLAMAIGCALLAAAVMYLDIRGDNRYSVKLFLMIPLALAAGVAWAVKTGVRKVTHGACVLAGILAAIGIFICDAVFLALYASNLKQDTFSMDWLIWSATHVASLMWAFSPICAVIDVASVVLGGFMCWGMRPKFTVTFSSLQMPMVAKVAAGKAEEMTMSASV